MTEELKAAEHRAYSRGYAAGRKRRKVEMQDDQAQKARQAFLDKAFLAALPVCMMIEHWTFGDKPIRSKEDRVKLAWNFAQEALKQRRYA